MRLSLLHSSGLASALVALLANVVVLAACDPLFPDPPKECDPAGNGANGCLSDEVCVDFHCVPRPKCETSEDCNSAAFECVLPAQICQLRPGFGDECQEPAAPCELGEFCALGLCRVSEEAFECAQRTDCPVGQKCDRVHLVCIPDGPCTLADEYPELACDPGEICDVLTGQCLLPCQEQCTPETAEADCGPQQHCDAACRCVDCLTNADCGGGLVCNVRAGRCQSENLCFSDEDCEAPLVCGASQLCEVPPPPCADDFDCAIAETCDVGSGRCILPGGPCDDDFLEESDTPASAELLDLAQGGIEIVEGLQLCSNDDDVYAIVLLAGDALIAEVTNTVPQARATMFLLDESGETSLRFAETAPRGSGRITYAAQEEETVFLRVTSLVGATPYDLHLERLGGAPCVPDFFEGAAGNDDLPNATPPNLVPDGVALSGTLCPEDEDLFRVDVGAGEAVSARLAFDGSVADLDVALLDETGAVVAQSAGAGAPEVVRQRFVAAGTVYVRVRGFGNSTGAYTLTVDHEAPFVCTPDAAEPDGDAGALTPLPLGTELPPTARTMCAEDTDLLVVPLEDFERLVVSAQYEDSDVELGIDVLDAAGTAVLASSPPATGGAGVSFDARDNETVLVRLRGKGGAVGPYTLRLERENQLDCAPDAGEPNNTVVGAGALREAGELLTICESDQDFFVVDGTAGKKLVVDASFRQADGDLDLMLVGIDGEQVLAVADGTADGEHLEVVLPLDGRYTLRVFSLTSGARTRYSLAVTQVTP